MTHRLTNGDFDISSLWRQLCGHLRPLTDGLPKHDELVTCASCIQRVAVSIGSHLRIGASEWLLNRRVMFCPYCATFTVPASEVCLANPSSSTQAEDIAITAINPRLWSSQELVLNLEPTTRCNFNCWYCVGRHMQQEDLSLESFKKILRNCEGVKLLALVGEGEPLMHKEIFSMIKIAKESNLLVYSLTNGSLLTEKNIPLICDSGLDYLGVSIDSVNQNYFADSRIRGDLRQIWKNLDILRDYKISNKLSHPRVSVRGTVFPHTQDEIPLIIQEAKLHGVDFIESFQPLNPKPSYAELYPINKRALTENQGGVISKILEGMKSSVLPDLYQEIESLHPQLRLTPENRAIRPNCDIPILYSLLSGQVTPCCFIKKFGEQSWNLTERSVRSVIGDPTYENMRFNLWNGFFLPECSGCPKTMGSPHSA